MDVSDLILINGRIITLDPQDTVTEALAVKDGKIQAVSTDNEILQYEGRTTDVIDLDGRTVTPGLISSHDHFLQYGVAAEFVLDVRYPKVKSCREIAETIAKRVREVEAGRWILASGWDETLLEERRFPQRWDLDPVTPDNPVWIRRVFEMGVANTIALEAAGITKDTPDPPLGRIDRDEGGEPTGVLRGRAMDMMVEAIPPLSLEEMEVALTRSCRDFNALGMTSVIEPGILMPQLKAYRSLHSKGGLSVRCFIQYGFLHDQNEVSEALEEVEIGGDNLLRVIGLKYALDGGVGPRTALMYEAFTDQPENTGMQLIETETLKEMTLMGHEAGFQIAIHAIGNKAIDTAMGAYEYAQSTSPRPDPRHQIVHCYFPSEDALQKIMDLGVVVNTQAPFLYWLGDSFIQSVGPERADRCIPLKTMLMRGIAVANSHDTTVTPPFPTIGLYASVERETISGESMGKEEAITPIQALRTYTTHAAHHAFMEEKIGSLERGKYADMTVWDGDPTDAERPMGLEVEITFVAGETVYRRGQHLSIREV
ncbi:MAG: amidohydrolase [Candidatus Bathyarchaeota archaeon]|jgi:predicted amidohydrolase YtcJ